MSANEDLSVFELEFVEANKALPHALRHTTTPRKKSVVASPRLSRSASSSLDDITRLWTGQFKETEEIYAQTKETDALSHLRWAQVPVLRYLFSENVTDAHVAMSRLTGAENAAVVLARMIAQELRPALDEQAAKKSLPRRLSRRLSLVLPIAAETVGLPGRDNPADLNPATLNATENHALERWREAQGYAVLAALLQAVIQYVMGSYVSAANSFARAYTLADYVLRTDAERARATGSLGLPSAILGEIVLVSPAWMSRTLDAVGVSVKDHACTLTSIFTNAKPNSEAQVYATMALGISLLMQADNECRLDRTTVLKGLSDILLGKPEWFPYIWLQSHIASRLGDLPRALEMSQQVRKKLCDPLRQNFDHAWLAFVDRQWNRAKDILEGVLDTRYQWIARAMLAVSCAAMNAMDEANMWLQLGIVAVNQHPQNRRLGAWKLKYQAMLARSSWDVAHYELVYLRGNLSWFDANTAATLRDGNRRYAETWITTCSQTLRGVMAASEAARMIDSACEPVDESSVLLHSSDSDPVEESLTASLLYGAALRLRGDIASAERVLLVVVNGDRSKERAKLDLWHTPFALHELALLEMHRENYIASRAFLVRAQKYSRTSLRVHSFYDELAYRLASSSRYLLALQRPAHVTPREWNKRKDELGVWQGEQHGGDAHIIMLPAGGVFQMKRAMGERTTLCWSWSVRELDVGFRVVFRHAGIDHVVEPLRQHEVHDAVEGFYTSQEAGDLLLVWDNTYSPHLVKHVEYRIFAGL